MKVQDIYLSPRTILSYLQDIERKIPHSEFSLYKPSVEQVSSVDDELLYTETVRMAESVGLKNYQVNVKFIKCKKGEGGNINLGHNADRNLNINVSEEYRSNWTATIAVLAHEICHKVLFVNGLHFPLESMNEVYTDLATIYVGFGELILNGYNTSTDSGTHLLGYLTPSTYRVTHLIVKCVFIEGSVMESDSGFDVFADIAVENWNKDEDKQQVMKSFFIKREEQMAECHRNILLLEGMLRQLRTDMRYDFDKLDNGFFKAPYDKTGKMRYPLAAFSEIYEYAVYEKSSHLAKLSKAINDAIYTLYLVYQEKGNYEMRYNFSCPFCEAKGKNKSIENRVAVIKCPSCGRHYTFDARTWNITSRQRELDDERRQKERKEKAEMEAFKLEVTEKITSMADKKIMEAQQKASQEVEEIRANEQQRAQEAMVQQLPSWLRWMVKRYII